jgi:orotidine-5'-phosphate decarboxylase
MMRAAAEAVRDEAAKLGRPAPILLAVTVLTSLADADLAQVGLAGPTRDAVLRLAMLAKSAGVDGVVCSPREAADVKREAGADFVCVTPGVRPAWAAANDQKRVMTPAQALANGADYVVVGRPLTAAADPAAALARLFEDA